MDDLLLYIVVGVISAVIVFKMMIKELIRRVNNKIRRLGEFSNECHRECIEYWKNEDWDKYEECFDKCMERKLLL